MHEAAALSKYYVRTNLNTIKDPKLISDKLNPNKMLYDSVRIIGLLAYADIAK